MPHRSIDTAVWSDDRFVDRSAPAKLVYFRLITGDDMGAAGAARVRAKRIAVDVELSTQEVESAIAELVESGLVRAYDDGWLWLPGWIKHQVSSINFVRAVRRQAAECPDALRVAICRALDEYVPRQNAAAKETEKRTQKPRQPRQKSNASVTEKAAPSRENAKTRPSDTQSLDQGSANPSSSDRGQEPLAPYGAKKALGASGGAEPPAPAPSPGAPAPAAAGEVGSSGQQVAELVPIRELIAADPAGWAQHLNGRMRSPP